MLSKRAKPGPEEEIAAAKKKFHLNMIIKERKERVLISTVISKLALDEHLSKIAYDDAYHD